MDGWPRYQLWYACDFLMHFQFQKGYSIVSGSLGSGFIVDILRNSPKVFPRGSSWSMIVKDIPKDYVHIIIKRLFPPRNWLMHLSLPAGTSGAQGQKISRSRPNTVLVPSGWSLNIWKEKGSGRRKGRSSPLNSKYPTLPLAHSECPINTHWVNSFDMQQTV